MNHEEIERELIVERYLVGQLTRPEAEQFEEHYLSCPTCLEQLELSEEFRQGIRQAATEDALRAQAAGRLGVATWLARIARSRRNGLAALVVLTAFALPMAYISHRWSQTRQDNAELAEQLTAARAPQPNAQVLALSPERSAPGAEPAARVRLPAESSWIVLALELELPEHQSYRVRLLDRDGETIWVGESLILNHLDTLTVGLHSSTLAAADYELLAEGLLPGGGTTEAGRFAFRVLPAASGQHRGP